VNKLEEEAWESLAMNVNAAHLLEGNLDKLDDNAWRSLCD
jgi:hypothetical protein